MRTVRLYGNLGKRFGRVHRLDVATPAEAVQALTANYPDFAHELIQSGERGIGYRCLVDGDQIEAEGLHWPMSREFRISPVINGAGKVGSIILGAVLLTAAIALAPATGGMSATLAMAGPFAAISYGSVALFGAALLLGGIAQALTPTPKTPAAADRSENGYFNGPVNVTQQGAAVPIGYGRCIVGSVVISAGVTIDQQDFSAPVIGGYDRSWL